MLNFNMSKNFVSESSMNCSFLYQIIYYYCKRQAMPFKASDHSPSPPHTPKQVSGELFVTPLRVEIYYGKSVKLASSHTLFMLRRVI